MSDSRPMLKRATVNFVVLGVSLGFSLAAVELAVRVAAPQQLIIGRPDLYQPMDSVGYRFRPGVDVIVNTGDGPARIVTDSFGFRSSAAVQAEPAVRLLLLGDSFMAALQVDHEFTLAGRMESDLSAALGAPVQVRNAGVPGWDPPQYRTFLRSIVDREHYDMIIVATYVGNDLVVEDRPYIPPFDLEPPSRFRFPRSVGWGELTAAFARPLNDRLEARSHAFILLKNRLDVLRMRLGLTGVYFPAGFARSDRTSPMWRVTADLLAALEELASARGIPVLYVVLPVDFQVNPALFAAYARGFGIDTTTIDLEQPNRLLTEVLGERGLHVVDALPALREAEGRGLRTYGRVDNHFSAGGHAVVWDVIRDDVLQALGHPEPPTLPGPG